MDTLVGADTTGAGGKMADRFGFPDPIGDFARSHGGYDYWARQVPILGSLYRAGDDARFWSDYQKNTGHTAKYPGRTYNSSMSGAYSAGMFLGSSMKKIYG